MSGHTEKCKSGTRRLIKTFDWFNVARGYIILFDYIIKEQIYIEKEVSKALGSNKTDYYWKTVKKWPVSVFEEKHGEFKPELVKPHGRKQLS